MYGFNGDRRRNIGEVKCNGDGLYRARVDGIRVYGEIRDDIWEVKGKIVGYGKINMRVKR